MKTFREFIAEASRVTGGLQHVMQNPDKSFTTTKKENLATQERLQHLSSLGTSTPKNFKDIKGESGNLEGHSSQHDDHVVTSSNRGRLVQVHKNGELVAKVENGKFTRGSEKEHGPMIGSHLSFARL